MIRKRDVTETPNSGFTWLFLNRACVYFLFQIIVEYKKTHTFNSTRLKSLIDFYS